MKFHHELVADWSNVSYFVINNTSSSMTKKCVWV